MTFWRRLSIPALALAALLSCGDGNGAVRRAASTASSLLAPTDNAPQVEQPAPTSTGTLEFTRPLVGPLRVVDGTVWDATGPRRIIGYSDFPALRIWEDDRAEAERTLAAAQRAGYHYVRIAYTLGETETQDGGYWRGAHVSPELSKRTLVPFTRAAKAHGIRVHIFGAHNWCKFVPANQCKDAEIQFATEMFTALRDAGLEDNIALLEWRNEWNITSPWGMGPDSYDVYGRWLREARRILPTALVTMGSPGEDDPEIRKTVCCSLAGSLASIDGMRNKHWTWLYMKHASGFYYRGRYQGGYLGTALWVTEPTGFDGGVGDVYTPLDDKEFLYGLYATYVVTGQVLTTFSGPSVRHRRPLDSVWGFYELPRLLRQIPEDIGTWRGPTWFVKDDKFVTVLAEEWGIHTRPDKPIKTWEFVTLSGLRIGGTGPIKLAPGWKAGIFLGEW